MSSIVRQRLALGLLVLVLIICNLTFPISSGWLRLFLNIFGYLGLFVSYKTAELSLVDIGLSHLNLRRGLKYGAYAMLVIAMVLLVVFFIDKQSFKDPRYHHDLVTALYASTVLLPLKTIIFEELAFRGIGLALLVKIKDNRWFASIISSLAFGLWHVSSSLRIGKYSIGGNIIVPRPLVILGAVFVTTAAGLVLCELRWRSKSLLAPIITHWFINAFATVLAAISWH